MSGSASAFGPASPPGPTRANECRVVVMRYLLLAVWPRPLVFDYGPYFAAAWSQLWPYAVALAALVARHARGPVAPVAGRSASPPPGFLSSLPRLPASCRWSRSRWPRTAFTCLWRGSWRSPCSAVFRPRRRRILPVFAAPGGWSWASPRPSATAAIPAPRRSGPTPSQRIRTIRARITIWPASWRRSPDRQSGRDRRIRGRPELESGQYKPTIISGSPSAPPDALPEAIVHFEAATRRLQPDLAEAHCNLGDAFAKVPGREAEAIDQYEEGLRLNPDNAKTRFDLACVLDRIPDRLPDAISQYQAPLRIEPDYAEAHYNLANDLKAEGRNRGGDHRIRSGGAAEAGLCRGPPQFGQCARRGGADGGCHRGVQGRAPPEARLRRNPFQLGDHALEDARRRGGSRRAAPRGPAASARKPAGPARSWMRSRPPSPESPFPGAGSLPRPAIDLNTIRSNVWVQPTPTMKRLLCFVALAIGPSLVFAQTTQNQSDSKDTVNSPQANAAAPEEPVGNAPIQNQSDINDTVYLQQANAGMALGNAIGNPVGRLAADLWLSPVHAGDAGVQPVSAIHGHGGRRA